MNHLFLKGALIVPLLSGASSVPPYDDPCTHTDCECEAQNPVVGAFNENFTADCQWLIGEPTLEKKTNGCCNRNENPGSTCEEQEEKPCVYKYVDNTLFELSIVTCTPGQVNCKYKVVKLNGQYPASWTTGSGISYHPNCGNPHGTTDPSVPCDTAAQRIMGIKVGCGNWVGGNPQFLAEREVTATCDDCEN